MEVSQCPDPCIDWFPRKFLEKYRRYYVNHEVVDRKALKKLERSLIKAFRFALAKLYRAKGYRLSREFLENPERFGPTPGVLWMLFLSDDEAIAVVGDSSIPRPSDKFANLFIEAFRSKLASYGYEIASAQLLDLSGRYGWSDAERLAYARVRGVSRVASAE